MRNRCILSLLICGVLLYYALPRLPFDGAGIELAFAWMWLGFVFIAIAGNLAAILYTPKRKKVHPYSKQAKDRQRAYYN